MAAPAGYIRWTIPGGNEAAAYGPTEGYDEAWAAMEAAMRGWVVRIDDAPPRVTVRNRLVLAGRRLGLDLHLKGDGRREPIYAWYSSRH